MTDLNLFAISDREFEDLCCDILSVSTLLCHYHGRECHREENRRRLRTVLIERRI